MEKLRVVLAFALLSTLITITLQVSPVAAPQETLIWEAYVYSDGMPVSSPVLEMGRQYRIEASGMFESVNLGTGVIEYAADVQYYTPYPSPPTWVWDEGNTFPAPDGHSFLQIDGMDVSWGPFSNGWIHGGNYGGHTYSIYYMGLGAQITFAVVDWIDEDYSNNWCHFHMKIYKGPMIVGKTAFAYGGPEYAWCFQDMDFDGDGKRDFRNWGWSNGPLGPGHCEFEIWAGAAKCDLSKGELVGTLIIDYDGMMGTATVTYMMDPDWTMGFAQLYVDGEPLPRDNKGEYTVAPGQYPYIAYVDGPTHTFPVSGLSGDPIYVVAHADVFEV